MFCRKENPDSQCTKRSSDPLAQQKMLRFLETIAQVQQPEESLAARKVIAQLEEDLSTNERSLLCQSFEVVFLQRQHPLFAALERASDIASERRQLQQDCLALCTEALRCLGQLLRITSTAEAQVFCYRMKGDYSRYQAELLLPEVHHRWAVLTAHASYAMALELAEKHLSAAHPERMRATFNYAVFLERQLESHEEALALAKEALQKAIANAQAVPIGLYDEMLAEMQFMIGGIALWESMK